MSNRALRKLRGNDSLVPEIDENVSEEDESQTSNLSRNKKNKLKVVNPFELLNEDGADSSHSEDNVAASTSEPISTDRNEDNINVEHDEHPNSAKKKKKKKKKKGKNKHVDLNEPGNDIEDEIDASIREVNRVLNNGNIGEDCHVSATQDSSFGAANKALLMVEHKHLNPDNEMKRIFGSRTIRAEQTSRRNPQSRRRQRISWMAQPRDNWPPIGKTGLTMSFKETKNGYQYFNFEHSKEYQQAQFQFYDAAESFNPQNIGNVMHVQPYHIHSLLQMSEVFRLSEDRQMAAELVERCLYGMEMAFHPLFNMTTGTCRLDFRLMENRCLYLALFKHILSLGQRGCYRTALEFCKFLLSLDPDGDPYCVLLMIDFYALRAEQYDYLVRLYNEWEAHRNLSQLPNFAFSVPLALFQQDDKNTNQADEMLQSSLLMFPGMLVPLLDKCGVQADSSASHPYFTSQEYSQPEALKQLIALYVGRCHSCWKPPEVVTWLERNVNAMLKRVDDKDPLVQEYNLRRQSRYKGTPRNIYRHILTAEIPSATAIIPQDVASSVWTYDPLPPTDAIETYKRITRPSRAQADGNALSMFLRTLLPNFNPNEPAPEEPEAAGGAEGNQLRQGVGALMNAMRDLLANIRMVDQDQPGEDPAGVEEGQNDEELDEWD